MSHVQTYRRGRLASGSEGMYMVTKTRGTTVSLIFEKGKGRLAEGYVGGQNVLGSALVRTRVCVWRGGMVW